MLKVNGVEIKQNHFPAGELFIKLPAQENGIVNIEWLYENDAELFTLICIRRHYQNYECHLNLPYIGHARMDRVKSEEDVFTLKYFCEIINSLKFKTVWVHDAHSNVSLALIDRVTNINPAPFIEKAISNIGQTITIKINESSTSSLIAFYPDEGAMKRYSDDTKLPYAFGIKKRDWQTGKIQGLEIQNQELVKGKNVLIIDDICSRGGTFYHSAKALKSIGAKEIYLYVTHCENTILEGELLTSDLIEKVYTTNSIFTKEHEKIEVFPL